MRAFGLVCGYIISKDSQAKAISIDEVSSWQPEQGILWLHFDIREKSAKEWLINDSGLPDQAIEILVSEETRPNVWREDDSLVMALRSVNLNPDSNPEDMVAVRIYADCHKIITTRRRSLLGLRDIAQGMRQGTGPSTIADMLSQITGNITQQLVDAIDALEDQMDALEDEVLTTNHLRHRSKIVALRRQCILLRRYLAPQREALARLSMESFSWLGAKQQMRQRTIADQLFRFVESIDAIKDRAAVIQDELASRASDKLNNRMYLLSLMAALFLPLSFILTIFDLQIAGKPLTEHPYGILAMLFMVLVVLTSQLWLFKRRGWF